jgi:hypothetical protein
MAIINLTWDAPSTDNGGGEADTYTVYRDGVVIKTASSTGSTDDVAEGVYIYTVTATNAAGEGPHSNSSSVTVPA